MKNKILKPLSLILVVALGFAGITATAATVDGNACNSSIIPITNAGSGGEIRHAGPAAYIYNSGNIISCGIPNSSYLGSTISVDISVWDSSSTQNFQCTATATDLTSGSTVGSDTVYSSSTGFQVLHASFPSPSGYSNQQLAYTVSCYAPDQTGVLNTDISSIVGIYLF